MKKIRKRWTKILVLGMIFLMSVCVQADGTYAPDGFSWSGGTGKAEISCEEVEIVGETVSAKIVFGSDSYQYVKLDGVQYDAMHGDGTSIFTIPVTLNKEETILAMTTKMSTPHEIEYKICVQMGAVSAQTEDGGAPEIPGLTFESEMALDYAQCFDVYYYQDGYALIDVHDSARYLVVPEGREAPEGLDESIVVLQKPLNNIYLAATSAMALFDSLDVLDAIKLSGTDVSGWYIDHAVEAMENGDILFAGKYSEPDYELLVKSDCTLAIESTMILHGPKVKEMIEMLGIPVLVDYSSYEEHPLGRTEWIRLYGVLVDKEEEAKAFFDEQTKVIEELRDFPNTEKKVAFFYVNMSGSVVVRRPGDYIPRMIEIAGGRYASEDIEEDEEDSSRHSSLEETMEEFYVQAADADYLIYNSSIDNPLNSIDDLLAKSDLFADFKAVREGNVWCTGKYLYQATDIVGNLITDIHQMLTGDDGSNMTFLYKLE